MGFLFSLLLGFVPVFFFAWFVYWMDRYEKEPKVLLGAVFAWGAVVAAGLAFLVNTTLATGVYLFTQSEAATNLTTGSLIAPVVEEILKGLAVLVVFLAARHEFDSLLDGIIYAGIVALGFAATENTLYIYRDGYLANGYAGLLGLAFVRVVLVGWQHPFYTAFIGIGLAVTRLARDQFLRVSAPLAGLFLAILLHSMHNTLATVARGFGGLVLGTFIDWSGWVFMLLLVLWATYREQQWIVTHLREEVARGCITPGQYRTACSAWSQGLARFGALFNGQFWSTSRFYQLCAELAYKKHQHTTSGEEGGHSQSIDQLRAELAELSPRAFD
jgi:RsiW-degrading membrane proteinase PrsW (M82 family)